MITLLLPFSSQFRCGALVKSKVYRGSVYRVTPHRSRLDPLCPIPSSMCFPMSHATRSVVFLSNSRRFVPSLSAFLYRDRDPVADHRRSCWTSRPIIMLNTLTRVLRYLFKSFFARIFSFLLSPHLCNIPCVFSALCPFTSISPFPPIVTRC